MKETPDCSDQIVNTLQIRKSSQYAGIVNSIFWESLYKDDEPMHNPVVTTGLVSTFRFHRERLESFRSLVSDILDHMPNDFHIDGGPFLDLCFDNTGKLWADLATAEQLMCLAMGLGMAEHCFSRVMWSILPNGMPVIVFNQHHRYRRDDCEANI